MKRNEFLDRACPSDCDHVCCPAGIDLDALLADTNAAALAEVKRLREALEAVIRCIDGRVSANVLTRLTQAKKVARAALATATTKGG